MAAGTGGFSASSLSMEVAGTEGEGTESGVESFEAMALDVADPFDPFEAAFDHHDGRVANGPFVPFEEGGPDHDVQESGFVLDGEKAETFGGPGPLAADHQPGRSDVGSVTPGLHLRGCHDVPLPKIPAEKS